MPAEPTPRERIAALETWRDEHIRHHDREDRRQDSRVSRNTVVWVGIISAIAAIASGTVTALITYWLTK